LPPLAVGTLPSGQLLPASGYNKQIQYTQNNIETPRITPRILKGYYERNPRITPRILKGYYEHTPRITPRILKGYDERVQG